MNFDPKRLREDFTVLSRKFNKKSIIYMDNACVTLRPDAVVKGMDEYYYMHPSCHKRSVHKLGKITTDSYAASRRAVSKFINAAAASEVVFTRNTTESINLVASAFSFKKGDVIITTDMEHNSNLIPWQVLCKKKEMTHKIFSLDENFAIDLETLRETLKAGARLVSVFFTSHITGQTLPVKEIIEMAHRYGALVLIDAAQGAPHRNIDVRELDADFLVFSFHKMLGPSGMGVLYAKKELLNNMAPFLTGGETVEDADYDSFSASASPEKFEAGLQNYAGAMGAAAAIKYLDGIGLSNIRRHELSLNEYITAEIAGWEKVRLVGPAPAGLRGSIVNFYIDGMDSGEVSILLDKAHNIMLRSGVHCSHPWYKKNRLPPTLRVSLYCYNTMEEAEIFIKTLGKIIKYF